MNILLYGLGKLTDQIEKIIRREHTIMGYTDSYSALQSYHNKKFYKIETINMIKFDYIIIAVQERKTSWEIRKMLIEKYRIEEKKIIPFSIYAKSEIVENLTVTVNEVDGIILGNSHAYCGYITDYLDGRFINLACPSQGIYHNYKVFQRYCEKMTTDLRYIVFDLYDYNFFNSDISLTKGLFDYIYWGGIKCKGNYDCNIHYSRKFEDELFEERYMLADLYKEEQESMDLIFGEYSNPIVIEKINKEVNNNWNIIRKDTALPIDKFLSDIILKRLEKTIKENIHLLKKFILLVNKKFPKCKIVFTLIPRYITMEKVQGIFMERWREEFESIIQNLQKTYGVYFINYKNRIDISENHHFFWDVNHLNTIGGRSLTSILNEDLRRISTKH